MVRKNTSYDFIPMPESETLKIWVEETGPSVVIRTYTGDQIRGQIKWYDYYDICFETTNQEIVVFRPNIVSILPVEE